MRKHCPEDNTEEFLTGDIVRIYQLDFMPHLRANTRDISHVRLFHGI